MDKVVFSLVFILLSSLDDPLNFIYTILLKVSSKSLGKFKLFRLGLVSITELVTMWVLIQSLYGDTINFLKQFIVIHMFVQPTCALLISAKLKETVQFKEVNFKFFCSMKNGNDQFLKAIQKDIVIANVMCIIIIATSLTTSLIFCCLDYIYEDSIFYLTWFLRKKSYYTEPIIIIIYLIIIILIFAISFPICCCIYVSTHLILQIKLLNFYLDKYLVHSQEIVLNTIEDTKYQNTIRNRLEYCVKLHICFKKVHNYYNEIANLPLWLLSFTGVCTVVVALYFILTEINPKFNCLMYGVIITMPLLYGSACFYGQGLKNASEDFYYKLLELPYYNWAPKNRHILIMLLNAAKFNFQTSSYGVIVLDFSLILRGMRLCYSLYALTKSIL